jgi:ABC-type enterochelin transport system permease subunit
MTIVEDVLVLLHFVGWAALLGGMLVQVREPARRVLPVMRDGIGTAFVTGLLLVGVLEAGDDPVDHAKIGVKFAVALVVLVLVMANLRKPRLPDGLFFGLLGLTLANMVVAIFWH